ncbi:MAG TPA: hypothetical protein VL244_04445 [Alphaproteobacteria bacterium]|nr:hypothetical protein [Alphaproteobacteria bacterium]
MIEVIIERWTQRDGHTDFMWSLWHHGKRAAMGDPLASSSEAEAQALAACRSTFRREPDRITKL